jgi:hypothetical protein
MLMAAPPRAPSFFLPDYTMPTETNEQINEIATDD